MPVTVLIVDDSKLARIVAGKALAKSLGASSALNVVKATMDGLAQLRSREEIAALRQ